MEFELFRAYERADGQTDVTNLIIAFHNFANASKHSEYFDTNCEVSVYEEKGFIINGISYAARFTIDTS